MFQSVSGIRFGLSCQKPFGERFPDEFSHQKSEGEQHLVVILSSGSDFLFFACFELVSCVSAMFERIPGIHSVLVSAGFGWISPSFQLVSVSFSSPEGESW